MESLLNPETPTPQATAYDTAKQILAVTAIWDHNPELALEAKEFRDLYKKSGPDSIAEMDAVNLLTDAIDVVAA